MKKVISFLICLIIAIAAAFPAFAKDEEQEISSSLGKSEISSNLVFNNSFSFTEPTAFWKSKNLELAVKSEHPMNSKNVNYLELKVDKKGSVSNLGMTYDNENYGYDIPVEAAKPNIHFTAGEKYDFSCFFKSIDFNGTIYVYLNSKSNKNVATELDISNSALDWKKVSCELEAAATETGALTIEFNGTGTLLLDFVQLIPHSAYGYGEKQYKYTTINSQAQKEIAEFSPEYITIACNDKSNNWKSTLGPAEERADSFFSVSNQTGITEYFNLSEEIGAKFLPAFYNRDISLQDILDLIEFANGDSVKTYWGAIRAANGHPEPYEIDTIGLCCDGITDGAEIDAKALQDEINKKYSYIKVIDVELNHEALPLQFIANSKPETDYTKTILIIAAPCAAVTAAVVIILVMKKRKR